MKRIVIDVRQSGTSTGRYHDKLVENLHKLKPEYEVTLLAHKHRVEFLRSIAPSFQVIQTDYPEFGFGEQLGFKKQVESLKPNLVHFGMIQQPVLYNGPAVTSMLDLTPLHFKNPSVNPLVYAVKQLVFGFTVKRVARKSKAVICISEHVKNQLVNFAGVPEDKIIVTYNAADKIKTPAEPVQSLNNEQFIMYVGRPQPHKNLGRLIDAFQLLLENSPALKLVLSGKKDALFLQHEKRVGELGLTKSVIFTDFVSESELRWLYENCQAYVFPSLSEGFGLPGLEAMVHGAPVVSSNASCLPEIYSDAAYYFNPLDVKDMTQKITDVLVDKKLRQELVEKGYLQAKKYSWEKTAEQTLEVYRKVLDRP